MKKLVSLILALCMVVCICAAATAEDKLFAGQKLVVSNFSFNAELLQKNIYDPFMAATGAELVIETGADRSKMTIKKWAVQSVDTVHDTPADDDDDDI